VLPFRIWNHVPSKATGNVSRNLCHRDEGRAEELAHLRVGEESAPEDGHPVAVARRPVLERNGSDHLEAVLFANPLFAKPPPEEFVVSDRLCLVA
jgi:hypothetical protein